MASVLYDEGTFEFTAEEQDKICALRKLVEDCPELEIGTEDVLLTKFLYFKKWNVQEAYKAIHNYYDFKAQNPDWTSNRNLEDLKDLYQKVKPRRVLKKRDKHGRVIIVQQMIDVFSQYPNYFNDIVQMDDLMFEAILLTPNGQKYGISIINDFQGVNKNFMKVFTPSNSKLINEKSEILPFTTNNIHMIQKGFFVSAAISLVMKFMSKEVKARMYNHDGKNFDKLYDMIGYENLPSEYGGPKDYSLNADDVDDVNTLLYEFIEKRWDYLKQIQSYKKVIKN